MVVTPTIVTCPKAGAIGEIRITIHDQCVHPPLSGKILFATEWDYDCSYPERLHIALLSTGLSDAMVTLKALNITKLRFYLFHGQCIEEGGEGGGWACYTLSDTSIVVVRTGV